MLIRREDFETVNENFAELKKVLIRREDFETIKTLSMKILLS